MLKRLLIITALLTVVILIAGAWLWVRNQRQTQTSFTLSDGSTIEFRGATFGTNHVPPGPMTWKRFLPNTFARWFKTSRFSTQNTESHSLVMWFNRRAAGNSAWDPYVCTIVHADESETAFNSSRFFAGTTATESLEGFSSPYPQREKWLHVRVYERKNLTVLGNFTLRNPKISRSPKWRAPTLPQTTKVENLEVSLVSLKVGNEWPRSTSIIDQQNHALFRVRDADVPSTNWIVERMEATDSTSNRLVSNSWSSGPEKELVKFDCQPALWSSETYKIRFEFSRRREAVFETNELWTIRGVAVPTNGGFMLVETQMNLGGFNVTLHGVSTPGATPPWGGSSGGSGDLSIGFSILPPPKGHRFTLVGATNDQGQTMSSIGSSYSERDWNYSFKTKDSQTLDITVALQRSRYVEFTAQPVKTDGEKRPTN